MSEGKEHPVRRLDDVVHQRVRLGILAVLAEVEGVEFSYVRSALGLTDGNLSRHLTVLEEAGYVRIQKIFEGKKPRTWVEATPKGKAALEAEMVILRELLARLGRVERAMTD